VKIQVSFIVKTRDMLSIAFFLILLLKPSLNQQTDCNDSLEYASDCPIWARYDECHTSPGFMEQFCKKSCNFCPATSQYLKPLLNFARSSPEMESESGCQCSKISVTLTNGAWQAQSSRQGTYGRSALVNGKPSWTTDSQAIWYVPESKFWCIGALTAIGTDFCGVSSAIGINDHFLNCVYGVPKNFWEFHASVNGWTIAGPNDVKVNCLNEEACQTVGGPDAHKSCKFPFVYQGKVFFTCTSVDNGHQPWCATEVNDKNHLIIGKWGSCSNSCPSPVQTTGKGNGRDPFQLEEAEISGLATIRQEENDYYINGTIAFIQDSSESPLNIQGDVNGVMPHVKHSIIIGNDCNSAAEHSNPENLVGHVRGDVNGAARFEFVLNTGFTLYGEHSIINKSVLIYESDKLGTHTGNNGKRLACATINEESGLSQWFDGWFSFNFGR